jgi:uncharacterized protein (DUF433 family)
MAVELCDMIVSNPEICGGRPTIRGTRLTVELVLEHLAAGYTETEMLDNFPTLTKDGMKACFNYARQLIADEEIQPSLPSAA